MVRVLCTLVVSFVAAAVVFRWLGEKARWSGISPDKQARLRRDVFDPDDFGIVPANSERGGPKDMWAVTYRGQTLGRWDRFEDAEADMLDRHRRLLSSARAARVR